MANWFTRALDTVTPWNRGGEVQRRQEKKKRDEEQQRFNRRNQGPALSVQPLAPQQTNLDQPIPQRPTNIFETLNKNLVFNQPQNAVPVVKRGSVVDALKEVGGNVAGASLGALRAGEGFVEGVAMLPDLATHATTYVPRKIAGDDSRVGRVLNEVNKAINTTTNKVNTPLKWLAKKTDEAAQAYGPGSRRIYKPAQVATNVATVVPGAVEGAAGIANKLSRLGKISEDSSVLRNLNAAKEFVAGQRVSPGLSKLDELLGGNLRKSKWLSKFMPEVDMPVSKPPTTIPVKKNIPVEATGDSLDIPVQARTPTKPTGPIIRDVRGGATEITSEATISERAAQIQRARADAENAVSVPGRKIDGITPRPGEKPFTLSPEAVAGNQEKLIDEYAGFLKDVGEGNGVSITADGRRVSNNARFGETGGKRMSGADWRAEAERQLQAGEADPSIQSVFNDTANPEVQSLLAKGERPDAPVGQPIVVREATGIPVRDEINVPQNLPETPGQVRVTANAEPVKAKSEAAAAQTPPAEPARTPETPVDAPSKSPASSQQVDSDIDSAYERLVKSLKENQKAQRVEKKITSAEKSRRFTEKKRIYNELVDSGVSRKEAEQRSMAAMEGKYADNTVANFDVDSDQAEAFRKAIDNVSDDPMNTKRAFEHLIDPSKTDPLQPWERTRIRQFVQKSLGEDAAMALEEAITMAEKSGDRTLMGNISGFVTSTIASGDISAVGRQGLQGLVNHPVMSKNAFTEALGALTSPDKYKKFVSGLANDADTAFIQENMGTHFLSLSDVADEARGASSAAEKFVGTRWFVNPSNRHYNTYLDSLRHQQSKAILSRYGGQDGFLKAAEASGDSSKWMKAWGKVVNAGTGRGSLGKSGSLAVGDVQVLFSARNLVSKLQRLGSPLDLKLLKTNPAAYRYQLKEVGTLAATIGAALTAVSASGLADIEDGKIKIGKSRYDISGGFMTVLNTMNNIRKSLSGDQSGGFARTPTDITKDYLQNQLSPMLGAIGRLMDVKPPTGDKGWRDKYGNEVNAGWFAKNALPLPGAVQSGTQSQQEGEGWMQTASNLFAEALGVNVGTYESAADKEAPKSQTAKDILKQFKKEGIGTTNEDIDNYVADKDFDKATRVAEYNLMKLKDNEKSGSAEIKKAEQTLKELGLRKDGVPMTDDGIQSRVENGDWDKAIEGYKYKIDRGKEDGEISDKTEGDIKNDIKRAEVARDNSITPELFSDYKGTSLSDWRKMGDPESDEYDPEMYQQLWDIDQKMTKDQVSYKKGSPDEPKYSAKEAGKGRGGKGKRQTDFSFGTLKNGSFAPRVQQYDTIDVKSGSVPHISVVRPNIVHKISSG